MRHAASNALTVTNRRLFTSDSSVRATGGSTVYQMNCRHISKGNTIVLMSEYSRVQVYCIRQSVVQCEQRLKLALPQRPNFPAYIDCIPSHHIILPSCASQPFFPAILPSHASQLCLPAMLVFVAVKPRPML